MGEDKQIHTDSRERPALRNVAQLAREGNGLAESPHRRAREQTLHMSRVRILPFRFFLSRSKDRRKLSDSLERQAVSGGGIGRRFEGHKTDTIRGTKGREEFAKNGLHGKETSGL